MSELIKANWPFLSSSYCPYWDAAIKWVLITWTDCSGSSTCTCKKPFSTLISTAFVYFSFSDESTITLSMHLSTSTCIIRYLLYFPKYLYVKIPVKKIITIDCDNVLCDTARTFLEYYTMTYGDVVPFEEMTNAYIQDNKTLTHIDQDNPLQQYIEFFQRTHKECSMKLIAWAQQWVKQLLNAWYELHVVTGRVEEQREATAERIEKYFPNCFTDTHFTNDLTNKSLPKWWVCQKLWAIVHIDDFYHYAETITELWIPVIMLDAPWNQVEKEDNLVLRVNAWGEVMEKVHNLDLNNS